MAKNATVVLRGTAMYAKVLGDPVLNYDKDGKEWKFDFIPDAQKETAKDLAGYGIGDRLRSKTKKDGTDLYEGKKFMSFRQREFTKDGKSNEPIAVVDALGKPWDDNALIGNGSRIDVRFAVVDYGEGKKHGVYPRKIRVLEHVPYEQDDFAPLSEDDEFFQHAVAAQKSYDNMDDEIPV